MREKLIKTWLPTALSIGITESEFWKLTMRRLNAYIAADKLKTERIDLYMHTMGTYVLAAINSSNMGASEWYIGKTNERPKYPEQPFMQAHKQEELSDEDLDDKIKSKLYNEDNWIKSLSGGNLPPTEL